MRAPALPPAVLARAAGRVPAWAAPALTAAAAAVACAVLALVDPSQPGRYPVCPFLALTGRWCPGCGSLRAVHQLLHGHPGAAVALNPLTVAVLPYLAYTWVAWASATVGGPRLRPVLPGAAAARALLVVVCAFWVLRNVPLAPFTALAP